eukprot:14700217-Alexandrium_andersonii.AAC.1
MSASLVGSEMCIRDSLSRQCGAPPAGGRSGRSRATRRMWTAPFHNAHQRSAPARGTAQGEGTANQKHGVEVQCGGVPICTARHPGAAQGENIANQRGGAATHRARR